MNGGLLVQDCTNHAIYYTHGITDGTVEYEKVADFSKIK